MLFQFKDKKALVVGTPYVGKITSVSILDEDDAKKERVLINASVEDYLTPAPASYSTVNEVGARLLNELMVNLEVKSISDLVGKQVSVKIVHNKNNEYVNTVISVPNKANSEQVEVADSTTKIVEANPFEKKIKSKKSE